MRRIRPSRVVMFVWGCLVLAVAPVPLMAQHWQDYSPDERSKALHNYRRYQAAPEEQRREVERQYQRWHDMTPAERERVQGNYERYRNLPREERKEFNLKYREWKRQGGQ